jgi:hypothetical protein
VFLKQSESLKCFSNVYLTASRRHRDGTIFCLAPSTETIRADGECHIDFPEAARENFTHLFSDREFELADVPVITVEVRVSVETERNDWRRECDAYVLVDGRRETVKISDLEENPGSDM